MSLKIEHMWRKKRLSWPILKTRLPLRGSRLHHRPSSIPLRMFNDRNKNAKLFHMHMVQGSELPHGMSPIRKHGGQARLKQGRERRKPWGKVTAHDHSLGSSSAKLQFSEAFQPSHMRASGLARVSRQKHRRVTPGPAGWGDAVRVSQGEDVRPRLWANSITA